MRLVNADVAKVFLNIEACEQIKRMPTVDPVHAAGGCYCRECIHKGGSSMQPEKVYCRLSGYYKNPDGFCDEGEALGRRT